MRSHSLEDAVTSWIFLFYPTASNYPFQRAAVCYRLITLQIKERCFMPSPALLCSDKVPGDLSGREAVSWETNLIECNTTGHVK